MPFLTFKLCEHKYKYTSLLKDLITKLIEIGQNGRKYSKHVPALEKIVAYIDKKQPQNNIETILLDLRVLNMLINEFKDNNELLAIFSNAVIKSINNKGTVNKIINNTH